MKFENQIIIAFTMVDNSDIPKKSEYDKMTLEEIKSMLYTYEYGLSNKSIKIKKKNPIKTPGHIRRNLND